MRRGCTCASTTARRSFLSSAAGLDNLIAAAMVSEDTRSRLRVHGQGVMVLLKAMRLRADGVGHPEDMVSMRIWIDERRVITTREEDVDPILELAEDISQGRGPATPGDFLCDLIEGAPRGSFRAGRDAGGWGGSDRQYVGSSPDGSGMPEHGQYPDRDLWLSSSSWPPASRFQTLTTLVVPPLNTNHRGRLEEHLNQLLRLLETLENLRDRIDILSDRANRIQERQLNQSSYVLPWYPQSSCP